MSDLIIDGDSLQATAGRIRQVLDSFATAGSDAHEAADHVGHHGLAGRVKEFADGWDIHRGRFSEELGHIADAFEAVDETFTDLDNRAAAAVGSALAAVAEAGATQGVGDR